MQKLDEDLSIVITGRGRAFCAEEYLREAIDLNGTEMKSIEEITLVRS